MASTSDHSVAHEHHVVDEEKGLGDHGLHRTSTMVTMPPEMFEKFYLTPKGPRVGDANKRFANPTALGLVGFVISSFTFAMISMGWGGAAGLSPVVGIFFFVGPVLLGFAMIAEWIMGNFFSMMVMGLFTVFWLSFGFLQLPTLQLGAGYATAVDPTGTPSQGFNSSVALYLLIWGFALFTFFIFTTKISAVFTMIFLFATTAIWLFSGAYWKLSTGDYEAAGKLQKAGGGILFVVAALGWYMTVVIMAGEMRLPINLPVGDLSHLWPRTDVPLGRDHKE